jgi:hypothetical protein
MTTKFFAIRVSTRYFYVRFGSAEHGAEIKTARRGGYVRLNWGSASWGF